MSLRTAYISRISVQGIEEKSKIPVKGTEDIAEGVQGSARSFLCV